jgi:hypothetical protein
MAGSKPSFYLSKRQIYVTLNSKYSSIMFKEGDGSMAGFLVGMNTSYNGIHPVDKQMDAPGNPQGNKEAEEAGKISKGEREPREERLPWADKAQKEDETPKDGFRRKEPGEECQTCKNRKYKDGSDENVSFKAAAHISPEAAAGRVRAHEGEHVANAYSKAAQKGGEVLSVSVRIETAVCPECGKNYVSGGTTSTKIRYPADSERAKEKGPQTDNQDKGTNRQQNVNPYSASQRQNQANAVRGKGFDYATRPLEEFEMERY